MTVDLHLYEPCAEGIKYLLAQSPDTESLVPGVSEAEWEEFGRRKGVKVGAPPHLQQSALGRGHIPSPPPQTPRTQSPCYSREDYAIHYAAVHS